jgi:hypothetical protein
LSRQAAAEAMRKSIARLQARWGFAKVEVKSDW